jgi:hypothetical protein
MSTKQLTKILEDLQHELVVKPAQLMGMDCAAIRDAYQPHANFDWIKVHLCVGKKDPKLHALTNEHVACFKNYTLCGDIYKYSESLSMCSDNHRQRRKDAIKSHYKLPVIYIGGHTAIEHHKTIRRYPPRSMKVHSIISLDDIAYVDSVVLLKKIRNYLLKNNFHYYHTDPYMAILKVFLKHGSFKCTAYMIGEYNLKIAFPSAIDSLRSGVSKFCIFIFDLVFANFALKRNNQCNIPNLDSWWFCRYITSMLYTQDLKLITHVIKKTANLDWPIEDATKIATLYKFDDVSDILKKFKRFCPTVANTVTVPSRVTCTCPFLIHSNK